VLSRFTDLIFFIYNSTYVTGNFAGDGETMQSSEELVGVTGAEIYAEFIPLSFTLVWQVSVCFVLSYW